MTLALSSDQAYARKLWALIVVLLCCVGCSDEAYVLDSTGQKRLAYCGDSIHWIKCISDACPNGFDIVVAPNSGTSTAGILKCR